MTVNEIIDSILDAKTKLSITNQQLADASGVPKTTVDRILRKDTGNPSMQTVLDMAQVVGLRLTNDNDTSFSCQPVGQQVIDMLERESRLKTVQANLVAAEKDRTIANKDWWIKFLVIALIIAVALLVLTWVCIALVWHYDFTHTDRGWIQAINNRYHSATFETFLPVADWIGKIWA